MLLCKLIDLKMKRNKSFNRDFHPEREPDEIFLGNSDSDDDSFFLKTSWETKRAGHTSYDIYGKVLGSRWPNSFPVFVKIAEIEKSEHASSILRSLRPKHLIANHRILPKLNKYHQEVVYHASVHGINLTKIRRVCGIGFAVKLFNYLYKQTCKKVKDKNIDKSINLIFPKQYCRHEFDYKKHYTSYLETLKDAGIKLNKWTEDFVDEDTGEVVTLHRANFKLMK